MITCPENIVQKINLIILRTMINYPLFGNNYLVRIMIIMNKSYLILSLNIMKLTKKKLNVIRFP